MEIKTLVSDDFGENTYLVMRDDGIILIDPGVPKTEIESQISNFKSQIKYILLTHGHYDHILSLNEFDPAIVYAHEDERKLLETPGINLSAMTGAPISISGINYYSGNSCKLGDIEFFHTPGHTAGSVIIKIGEGLFTGDTLFYDTIGRCDLPTGNPKQMQQSLRIFAGFDGNMTIYPGHGGPVKLHDVLRVNYFLKKL